MTQSSVPALDVARMQRALQAARLGDTRPNPHVGAVVLDSNGDEHVGFHTKAGGPHAEIAALQKAGAAAIGGTLYCTLEPCNHHGKTPPCAEAIVRAGIRRVVFGVADPIRHGAVCGAEYLRAAGIEVVSGVASKECLALIEDFTVLATKGRPWINWKIAMTLDGIVAADQEPTAAARDVSDWITSPASREIVQALRAQADCILVGAQTVAADNPRLSLRTPAVPARQQPLRVVFNRDLSLSLDHHVFASNHGEQATLVFHGAHSEGEKARALLVRGVNLFELPVVDRHLDLAAALRELGRRGHMRALLETGPALGGAFLRAGLLDEMTVFVAPKLMGAGRSLQETVAPRAFFANAEQLSFSHAAQIEGGDLMLRVRL